MLQSLTTNYNYVAAHSVGNEITSCILGKICFTLVRELQTHTHTHIYIYIHTHTYTYRVIQKESARLWEMIVCVILSKKVHINMCPILDGYGVMTVF